MQHDADWAAARFVKTYRAALPHLKTFFEQIFECSIDKVIPFV